MSTVRIRVNDADNNNPIEDATIYSLNSSKEQTGVLGTTDNNGAADIEAPSFGQMVEVGFPGYESQSLDPAFFPYEGVVYLKPTSENLAGVVVKAVKKKIASPDYTLPVVLGISSVIFFGLWFWKKSV